MGPLLDRKQCNIQLIHPEMANVSKAQIKEALAKKLKSDESKITVFGLKTKFGGGRSSGFALIYNTADDKAKYDSTTMLRRDGIKTKPKVGRKAKKEIKSRRKRVHGTAKAKVQAGKQRRNELPSPRWPATKCQTTIE